MVCVRSADWRMARDHRNNRAGGNRPRARCWSRPPCRTTRRGHRSVVGHLVRGGPGPARSGRARCPSYAGRRLIAPKRGPWRAHVVLHEVAERQIDAMSDAEREILDQVIVRLSLDHRIGTRVEGKLEREYRDDRVRVVYIPTALGVVRRDRWSSAGGEAGRIRGRAVPGSAPGASAVGCHRDPRLLERNLGTHRVVILQQHSAARPGTLPGGCSTRLPHGPLVGHGGDLERILLEFVPSGATCLDIVADRPQRHHLLRVVSAPSALDRAWSSSRSRHLSWRVLTVMTLHPRPRTLPRITRAPSKVRVGSRLTRKSAPY